MCVADADYTRFAVSAWGIWHASGRYVRRAMSGGLLITSSKHRGGTLRLGSTPSMSLKGEKSSMVVLW
jgi:hypothetical protein